MLSRRKFLIGASAAAAASVATANALAPAADLLTNISPAWVPEGFILPRGQTVSRAMYRELFAVIGEVYGRSGPTTFKLPNFAQPGSIQILLATRSAAMIPAGTLISYYSV